MVFIVRNKNLINHSHFQKHSFDQVTYQNEVQFPQVQTNKQRPQPHSFQHQNQARNQPLAASMEGMAKGLEHIPVSTKPNYQTIFTRIQALQRSMIRQTRPFLMGLTKQERQMQTQIREKFTSMPNLKTSQQLVGYVYRMESELPLYANNQHPEQLAMYRMITEDMKEVTQKEREVQAEKNSHANKGGH